MNSTSLWYDVEQIKKWIRRRKILSAIKYTLYAILIVGIIIYLISIYDAAQSIEVTMYRSPSLERMGFMAYRITAYPNIVNPTGTSFEAKNVYVKIFVNGYYVSEIFKPYLRINPGNNLEKISFELNLRDLPEIVKEVASNEGVIKVKFEGIATIPLKAFGIIPWHEVTVPLELLPEQEFQLSSEDTSFLSKLTRLNLRSPADISALKAEVERLRGDLDKTLTEFSNLKLKMADISQRIDKVESLVTKLSDRLSDVDELISELSSLKSELNELRRRLEGIPEIYQLRIVRVKYPFVAKQQEQVMIEIIIEYTFSKPTDIYISLLDLETFTTLASIDDTLQGSGLKTYEFKVKTPTNLGLWRISASSSYYRDSEFITSDTKNIQIAITM